MVIHTTVTTLGLGCEVARSVFPSIFRGWDGRRHGQSYLREMEFAVNVEGCTESWRGGVCPECRGRHIPSEGSVSRCPLTETGTLKWWMETRTPATSIEVLDKEEYLNWTQNTLDEDEESIISFIDVNGKFKPVWINVKTNLAMDMAIKNNLKKQECTVEEMVPKESMNS